MFGKKSLTVGDRTITVPKHRGNCAKSVHFTMRKQTLSCLKGPPRVAKDDNAAHKKKRLNLMANLPAELFMDVLDHIPGDDQISLRRTCTGLFNTINRKPENLGQTELDSFVSANHQRRFEKVDPEHANLQQCRYCADSHDTSAFEQASDSDCAASKRIFRFTAYRSFMHEALWALTRETHDQEKPRNLVIKYTNGMRFLRQELTAINGNIKAVNTFAIAKIPNNASAPADDAVYSELQKLDIWMTAHVNLTDMGIFAAYDEDKLKPRKGNAGCVKADSRSCPVIDCNCTTWHFERVPFDPTSTEDAVLLKIERNLSHTKRHNRLARPQQKAWRTMSILPEEWDFEAARLGDIVEFENGLIFDDLNQVPMVDRTIGYNMTGYETNF